MSRRKDLTGSKELSKIVVKGMQEKKALDIVILNLTKIKNAVADYFVICSGNSNTQLDAISDSIDQQVHQHANQNPWHWEGKENKEWILLDYVDVVVHIFIKERREFYALEDLWGDAEVLKIDEEVIIS